MSFTDDIQGQNTQLFPIVTIEDPDALNSPWLSVLQQIIRLSTNNVSLDHIHSINSVSWGLKGHHFKPLLLNVPSIKESIDIESRKFKISNVNLEISNYEYEGNRFTDILSDKSLINWKVSIQFVSPTANKFSTIFDVNDFEGNAPNPSFYNAYNSLFWGDETQAPFYNGEANGMTKMIYQGIIRRITHDDTKVSIELEDLTEQKAHKNLPSEQLGSADNMLDKYKNKPIPMVYGTVTRSPVVIDGAGGDYKFKADYKPLNFFKYELNPIGENTFSPLWIMSDGVYYNVVETIEEIMDWTDYIVELSGGSLQPITTGVTRQIDVDINDESIVLKMSNPLITVNALQVKYSGPPKIMQLFKMPYGDFLGGVEPSIAELFYEVDQNLFSNEDIANLMDTENSVSTEIYGNRWSWIPAMESIDIYERYEVFNNSFGLKFGNPDIFIEAKLTKVVMDDIPIATQNYVNEAHYTLDQTYDSAGGSGAINHYAHNEEIEGSEFEPLISMEYFTDIHTGTEIAPGDTGTNFPISITIGNIEIEGGPHGETFERQPFVRVGTTPTFFMLTWGVYFNFYPSDQSEGYWAKFYQDSCLRLNDVGVNIIGDLEDPLKKDFVVSVSGRVNTFDDHPGGLTNNYGWDGDIVDDDNSLADFIQNPIDIIYDLVRSEIGFHNINQEEYLAAREEHQDWKFAFTITKKINSKALIEDIAKSTKCFPRFKNDGSFGFGVIKNNYTVPNWELDESEWDGTTDYEKASLIKAEEVISFSFKKTAANQIYNKVDVQYNKDYIEDSYLGRTDPPLEATNDQMLYYGMRESYLEFESDYIRGEDSSQADKLAQFLLENHKNDHLIIKMKLPLKYMALISGEFIKFRRLMGDVVPYGIDYRKLEEINGQWRYPFLFITSIKKSLDSVDVECMQMHSLSDDIDLSLWGIDEDGGFNDSIDDEDDIIIGEEIVIIGPDDILGCMNPDSENYDETATVDDGSCILPQEPAFEFTNLPEDLLFEFGHPYSYNDLLGLMTATDAEGNEIGINGKSLTFQNWGSSPYRSSLDASSAHAWYHSFIGYQHKIVYQASDSLGNTIWSDGIKLELNLPTEPPVINSFLETTGSEISGYNDFGINYLGDLIISNCFVSTTIDFRDYPEFAQGNFIKVSFVYRNIEWWKIFKIQAVDDVNGQALAVEGRSWAPWFHSFEATSSGSSWSLNNWAINPDNGVPNRFATHSDGMYGNWNGGIPGLYFSAPSDEELFVPGDVNLTGDLNMIDVYNMISMITDPNYFGGSLWPEPSPWSIANTDNPELSTLLADFNQDGYFLASDVQALGILVNGL